MEKACVLSQTWYYYILTACITYFGGLLILIPSRVLWYLCNRDTQLEDQERCGRVQKARQGISQGMRKFRAMTLSWLSGNNIWSITLVTIVFAMNMLSIIIYIFEATSYSFNECGKVTKSPAQLLNIALSVVFIVHYVIKFIATTDKLYFWLDVFSIVDHFTIVPTLYGLYVDTNWLGLRFMRLLYLLQVSEVLQMLHILRSRRTIRLTQIFCTFISIWFASSGFVHLCENTGDPFFNFENSQVLGYWHCVYWLLVTMSTVGFGEMTPSTDIGRAFIVLFIVGSFAMFTAIVPELVSLVGMRNKYNKPYKRTYGKRHVVVCGHITYDSASHFIHDFCHDDSENRNINVVFVSSEKPSLELEAFFNRHASDISFIIGSIMDLGTLEYVKLKHSAALLILADRNCEDADEEDAKNIMRAIAAKNHTPSIRVIIQLINFKSKKNLLQIPNWRTGGLHGDRVLCISELKLGLMAQNCLAPGASTLLCNLFTMRSYKPGREDNWQDHYRRGAANEIYTHPLPERFVGMSFHQVAEYYYLSNNVLLVGITECNSTTERATRIRINPNKNSIIRENMIGYFFADSPEEIRRAASLDNPIKRKDAHFKAPLELMPTDLNKNLINESLLEVPHTSYRERRPSMGVSSHVEEIHDQPNKLKDLDASAMYHTSAVRKMEEAIKTEEDFAAMNLKNHVVVCLKSDASSPCINLINFVRPLRTSSFRFEELSDIIIIGDPAYLAKEWPLLKRIPKLYIFNGSPNHRPDLKAVSVDRCAMCIILSAKRNIRVDDTLLDKETILTNMSINGMFGREVEEKIKAMGLNNTKEIMKIAGTSHQIPLTIELDIDDNVAYIDQDDEDDPDCPLYLTQPFASGSTFAASSLESLMSAAFTNSGVLSLICALVTGGETSEIEQIVAESLGVVRDISEEEVMETRQRCYLSQLPLDEGIMSGIVRGLESENVTYGKIFQAALQYHAILCLGLYRLMDPSSSTTGKRYVITNPPVDFPIRADDKIYCFQPSSYNTGFSEQPTSSAPLPAPTPPGTPQIYIMA